MKPNVKPRDLMALRNARAMAAEWKGNKYPDEHDEFDAMIAEIDTAIERVEQDRKLLLRTTPSASTS